MILGSAMATGVGLVLVFQFKASESDPTPDRLDSASVRSSFPFRGPMHEGQREDVSVADLQPEPSRETDFSARAPDEAETVHADQQSLLMDYRFLLNPPRNEGMPIGSYLAAGALLNLFASEARDPVWSSATESVIFDKIANVAPVRGLAHIEVECKTSLCRVHLVFAGETQRPAGADGIPLMAAIRASALLREIRMSEDLDLRAAMGGTRFNDYGMPVSLFYFRRE